MTAGRVETTTRDEATERVWMVERTFSADSPPTLAVVYATPDGTRYLREERAFDRFASTPAPEVTAAATVESDRLTPVSTPDLRERYAKEAERMRERHDLDEAV